MKAERRMSPMDGAIMGMVAVIIPVVSVTAGLVVVIRDQLKKIGKRLDEIERALARDGSSDRRSRPC